MCYHCIENRQIVTESSPFFHPAPTPLMYSQEAIHATKERLAGMTRKSFWFASRPLDTEHHHPFLVFDLQDRLCFHLTVYGKEAVVQTSYSSAQTYLHAILPW